MEIEVKQIEYFYNGIQNSVMWKNFRRYNRGLFQSRLKIRENAVYELLD
jgi:hypothetical protein